jgi:hypothetical protein
MKNAKAIFLFGSIFFSSLVAQAQFQKGKYKKQTLEERVEKYTAEITSYVSNVTDSQKVALFAINKAVTLKFDSIKNLELDPVDYRPAARSVFVYRDAAIKKVLNETQYDEYLMLQAEKKEAAFKRRSQQQGDSTQKRKPFMGNQE